MQIHEIFDRLREITESPINLSFSDYEGAKASLKEARNYQKELRSLKREVNHLMTDLRSDYSQKSADVGKGFGTALLSFASGQRTAGKLNAIEKRRLRAERDEKLEPYEGCKRIIDDLILQLDRAKDAITTSEIYANKSTVQRRTSRKSGGSKLKAKSKGHYAHLNGEVKGPFSVAEIEGLLKAGVADASTQLCVEGEEDWHSLSHFFEGV